MKVSIIYFTESGNTAKAAEIIKDGMMKVEGTEVKLFGLDAIDEEYVAASDAVLFGAPTYYAGVAWQLVKFFHETKIPFAGKLGAAFSTAGYEQGGSEVVLSDIISFMLSKGMLCYSGGTALGQPFTHLGATGFSDRIEDRREVFEALGQRVAAKAKELFE